MNNLKKTFLHSYHINKLKASIMGPFAGYDMPIEYKNLGISKETMACRQKAAFFDVSHMGQLRIFGKDRSEFMEKLLVGDSANLEENNCSLSLILNKEGGIMDDVIFSKHKEHFNLVLNAGNKYKDLEHINFLKEEYFKNKEVILDFRQNVSLIALQGPESANVLQKLLKTDLSKIGFMQFFSEKIPGYPKEITFYRSGYTGEDGFEISISDCCVEKFCDELFTNSNVIPAGLGARDTLRLEVGLCLHGHEISDTISPVESLLQWTIRKKNLITDFYGFDKFLEIKGNPKKIKRVGVKLLKGGVLREGCDIFSEDLKKIGNLTSGAFSPVLKKGIGMGFVGNKFRKAGTKIVVDIRGRKVPAVVEKLPFIPANYYRL